MATAPPAIPPLTPGTTLAMMRQESDPLGALFASTAVMTPLSVRSCKSTELHLAVARGDVTTATRLVAQSRRVSGTDMEALVNAANEHGFTALHSASAFENEDAACALIQLLLNARANPHAVDREGFGPMHWAAFVGGTDRLRLLQEGGADVNLPSAKLGDTPLHRACRAGHAATIAALVAAGADTRMQNRAMLAPYDVAGASDESLLRADVRSRAVRALTDADSSLRTLVLHHDDCLRHVTREGHQVSSL